MTASKRTLIAHVVYRLGVERWHVMNENLDLGKPGRARNCWLVTTEKAAALGAALNQRLAAGGLIYDTTGRPVPPGGCVEEGRFMSRIDVPVTLGECPACHAATEVGYSGVCIDDNRPIILARCTACTYVELLASGDHKP